MSRAALRSARAGRAALRSARWSLPMTPTRFKPILFGALAVAALFCSPATDAFAAIGWQPTGSLSVPRADHTATLLEDGSVLVAGGRSPNFSTEASAELYDPSTGRWTTLPPMSSARYDHTASLLDGPACSAAMPPSWCGDVLVVGGTGSASAELFDPATRSWSPTTAPPAAPRREHTATGLDGPACTTGMPPSWCGKVLVAGGEAPTSPPARLDSAELYDPATSTWGPADSLTDARAGHNAILLGSGQPLAVGGRGESGETGESIGSAELYDPDADTWNPAGSLTIARHTATINLLPDGRPLVAGGLALAGPRRSAEIYDPAAPGGPWVDAGSMNQSHIHHTATALPDGTTLVAGNDPASADANLTEIYRPDTASWSAGAAMAEGRGRHTATFLSGSRCAPRCGYVLVVGGRRGITPIAGAELYGTLPPPPPPPPPPPVRPIVRVTDLAASAKSARRIRLTFSAPALPGRGTTPAARYVIKQARRPVTSASFSRGRSLCRRVCRFSPRAMGDRITLTVTGLDASRTYHYALRAIGPTGGQGPTSNRAKAKTRRDRIGPGRVKGLAAGARSGKARLSFRAPASDGTKGPPVRQYQFKQSRRPIRGARGFRRARSLCRRTCRFSPGRVGARLTLTVAGLCRPGKYYYAIRARDEGGNLGPKANFRMVRVKRSRRCRTR